jgi:hypothetical protein
MRYFYELAEAHRDRHGGKADWIKFYLDEAGIELMSPELLEAMGACVEGAKSVVESGSRFAKRVGVVAEAFRLTRDYATLHQARNDLVAACMEGDASALPELVEDFHSLRAAFLSYVNEFLKNPYHETLRHFAQMAQSDPTPMALMWLSSIPAEYDSISPVVEGWRTGKRVPAVRNMYLRHAEGQSRRLSFLGPDLPVIPGWHFNFRPYEHFCVEGVIGGRGIHITGTDMCSFFAEVPIDSGDGYVLDFDCSYRISPDNRTQVYMDWYGADYELLQWTMPLQLPRGESDRVRLRIPSIAPEGAHLLKIRFLISRQGTDDFLKLHRVRLDRVPLTAPPKG